MFFLFPFYFHHDALHVLEAPGQLSIRTRQSEPLTPSVNRKSVKQL